MTDVLPLVHMAVKGWTSDVCHPHNSLLAGLVRPAVVCFVLPVMHLLLRHLLAAFGLLVHLGEEISPAGPLDRVQFLLLWTLAIAWACLGALLGTLGCRFLLRQGEGTGLGEACTDLQMVFQLLAHGEHLF